MMKVSSATNKKFGVFYLFIYSKLLQRYKHEIDISIVSIIDLLKEHIYHMPKNYRYGVLRDLIRYGFLIKLNRYKCRLVLTNYNKIIKPLEEIDTIFAWE